MGRETANGEVLYTEGTMREDKRPDFRPTSKSNKAFTPRSYYLIPFGRRAFYLFFFFFFFF
jgi:hypothetical protein